MFADIGIGIILSVIFSHVFNIELNIFLMTVSIACALLPDIDMLVFVFPKLKKIFVGHRGITHYPIIYIPIAILVLLIWGKMWALLFITAILIHFIHDTLWIGSGVKWLWPFSQKSYKFFPQDKLSKPGEHWVTTFYLRVNKVTVIEYFIFILGLFVLVYRY